MSTETQNQTNAQDATTAATLSSIGASGNGTLASIILRKKGTVRGTAPNKVIYGDDYVHVLIWTGFTYKALVERSHKKLHEIWGQGSLFKDLLKTVIDQGHFDATLDDVAVAVQELDANFLKVINGGEYEEDGPYVPSEDHVAVWEPLKVDGQVVQGAKVYVGQGNSKDPRAPVKGTIYIDGVKLGEKVLEAAPNGHWLAKQKPKTVAKEILRSMLPVGLYVRYCLAPESVTLTKVGAEAANHAKSAGVHVEPEAIRSLFKIAA